jgi:tetratricopeptide (TPR) repeat protein
LRPEAAASPWVNKEVAYWLEYKSIDTLLIAMTDGELAWDSDAGDFDWSEGTPLPPVLTGRFTSEPKWVDLRAYRAGTDPREARFIEHAADFAAAIRGMPKEDLLSHEVRQQRRALTLAWSTAGTLAVLIALAGWQWWEAESAKRVAEAQRDRATRNFELAKKAADHVVFGVVGLAGAVGMQVEMRRDLLEGIQTMMDLMARVAPNDLELQHSRATMLGEIAVIYTRAGDVTRARSAAEESLTIMRKLATTEPAKAQWRHGVGTSLGKIGDVQLIAGDRAAALAAYEERLAIMRQFAVADPGNSEWQLELSVSLYQVGDARMVAGDWAGASAAYEESLAAIRKLAASDPNDKQRSHVLSLSLSKLGELRMRTGDPKGALASYEEGLAIARQLADDGVSRRQNVSAILVRIGAVYRALGDWAFALYGRADLMSG